MSEQPDYSAWLGRKEVSGDDATELVAARMAGLLDREPPKKGQPWPATWIWALFWPALRHDSVGTDGHAGRGNFLPPIELPRRMWVGSSISIDAPIVVGEAVTRTSIISSITHKHGRSGRLCLVQVEHLIEGTFGGRIREIQTIAYREHGGLASAAPVPNRNGAGFEAEWRRTVMPDPVLLFQYSAVTYNTHRIHYDQPYATSVEGYPSLLVHGPLTATMLIELARAGKSEADVKECRIAARRPLFADTAFELVGRSDGDVFRLAALDHNEEVAMTIDGRWR
jgi:3-methylfumaryl-CoA hydratase